MSSDKKLRLITYMSPGIPVELYETIGDYLEQETGMETTLLYESRWAGPPANRKDPFTMDEVDIGKSFGIEGSRNKCIYMLAYFCIQ